MAAAADERTRRWTLAVTILGSSLAFIDVTAINVVVPTIQRDLDTTVVAMQWVVEAYTLFLASVLLVGGALGDKLGRKRVFGGGLALFTLASLGAGAAPDATWLIGARAAQGLGAALLVPASLAIIGAVFPDEARGRAVGIWSGASALTAVLGPVLGGVVSDLWSWRWVFLVNGPLGLIILALLVWRVPETRDENAPKRLDHLGAVLATVSLGALTFGLIEGGARAFTEPAVVAALVVGVVAFPAFLLRERRARHPMLPLGLFRDRAFAAANGLTFLVYGGLAAGMFFLPMRLIFLDGYSPSAAGFAVVPTMVLIGVMSLLMGHLVARHGPRRYLMAGPVIAGAGFASTGIGAAGADYWWFIFPGVVAIGVGMGLLVAPLTETVLASVPRGRVGTASGVNNAVSRVAALVAIAVAGVVALSVFGSVLDDGLADVALTPQEEQAVRAERVALADADPPEGLSQEKAAAVERVYDDAFLAAFRAVQGVMGASVALGGVVGAAVPRRLKAPAP